MPSPNPYFLYPFASLATPTSDVVPIPNTGADSGGVNYQYGFTPPYEYPSSNPSNLPVPRQQFNQLMLDITTALQQLQTQGYPLWIAPAVGSAQGGPVNYPIYSVVAYNAGSGILIYESQVAKNASVPGADGNWVVISGSSLQVQTGTIIDYAGMTVLSGYVACDFSEYPRVGTYANLFNALTSVQTTTTSTTSNNITVSSTNQFYVGMAVENGPAGTGIQTGTVVSAVVSGTVVTLSLTPTVNGSQAVRFYSVTGGAGDGSTTFRVPNILGRYTRGQGVPAVGVIGASVGQTGGSDTYTMIPSDLVGHTHPFNVPINTTSAALTATTRANSTGSTNLSLTTGSSATGGQTAMPITPSSYTTYKLIKI